MFIEQWIPMCTYICNGYDDCNCGDFNQEDFNLEVILYYIYYLYVMIYHI